MRFTQASSAPRAETLVLEEEEFAVGRGGRLVGQEPPEGHETEVEFRFRHRDFPRGLDGNLPLCARIVPLAIFQAKALRPPQILRGRSAAVAWRESLAARSAL